MITEKYPASSMGVYFTAIHLAVFSIAYTFKGLAIFLVLPYLPAELLWKQIGGADSWISTLMLAVVMFLSLVAVIYLMYPFGKTGYRKRTYFAVMIILMFIIHPFVFYLYVLLIDYHFTNQALSSEYFLNTFPFSSLSFLFFGSLIDRIVMKRVAVARHK
jgi:hypothetical protein